MTTVIIGVVALRTPASALETNVSASAKRNAGMTFTNNAKMADAPHSRADRDNGMRRTPLHASNAPAPRSVRKLATPNGVNDSSDTLMKRNESPHTMPRETNPGNHIDARGVDEVAGDTYEL